MKGISIRVHLLALVVLGLLGCSGAETRAQLESAYKQQQLEASDLASTLKRGDIVEVTSAKTGKRYVFRVNRVGPDSFWGTAQNKKEYCVLYAGLKTVYARRKKDDGERFGDAVIWLFTGIDNIGFIQ